MKSINNVVLTGNVANEPKYIEKDKTKVLNFALAINSAYKKDDEYVNRVEYFQVKTYGNLALALSEKMAKGAKIELVGSLRSKKFETKDGDTQYEIFVEVDRTGSINCTPTSKEDK